jgi:NADH-quinone oxidoreductase subunit M
VEAPANLLSWLVWLPVLAGFAVLLLGDRRIAAGRWVALAATLATLALCLPLWGGFNRATAALQFIEQQPWIGILNAWYYLGVDGISMPLIVLTAFTTPLVVIAAWSNIEKRPAQYFASFLVMEGLMIGVFAAADALLFYVLWEAMLIPMFLIIGIWGGSRRVYATIKFFLYTFLGSVLMLVALIWLYLQGGSYEIAYLQQMQIGMTAQVLIFLAFFAAFAVKVPMWPVHTWLPDAHVEAPTGGSVILAAIMLKMGGYGFLRFSLPIAPDASRELDWLVIALSLVAIAYIGFVALAQRDMKKLIAYSSIAHMGFVTLGAFVAYDIWQATGAATGRGWASTARWCRWCRTASCRARCSSASACCTTACTPATSRPTAASSTRCRCSRSSPSCSRWRTPACRARPASSASSSSSYRASRRTSGTPSSPR